MSLSYDVARVLKQRAVLNTNESGDNVSVTIPIEDWREFWSLLAQVERADRVPYKEN